MTTTTSPAAVDLWHALRRTVRGPVLQPADDGWAALVRGHNPAHALRPAVAVSPLDTADVSAALAAAAASRAPVDVQATGHGRTAPLDGGLLLLTHRLDLLEVDAATGRLRVGAGVAAGTAVAQAEEAGWTLPAGSATSVGLVGLTLGGGLGPLGRALGWTSDHLRAVELVAPGGQVLQVDAGTEPDLFWALRGGKTGLGVVTAMTFDFVPLPRVVGRRALVDVGGRPDLTRLLLRRWAAAAEPDAVTSALRLMDLPDLPFLPAPLRGRSLVEVTVTSADADAAGDDALAALFEGVVPLLEQRTEGGLTAWYASLGDPAEPAPSWQCGRLLAGLDDEAVEALLGVLTPAHGLPVLAVELRRLGGRLAADRDDAVGGRDATAGLSVVGVPDPALFGTVLPAVFARLEGALQPWLHGGTQVNFHGPVTAESPLHRAWSGPVADRLAAVRRRVDPLGLLAPVG